jgi:cytochrome P450
LARSFGRLRAGLDTTINTISSALHLFAQNPDQWDLLRERPDLVPQAYNEVLRIASPALGFTRVAAHATTIGDQPINDGDRVLLHFAAANRDPRKYADPSRFNIMRSPSDHIASGIGRHHFAGQLLARLEAESDPTGCRFEAGAPVYHLNNVIRGLASLSMKVAV